MRVVEETLGNVDGNSINKEEERMLRSCDILEKKKFFEGENRIDPFRSIGLTKDCLDIGL
jgi:hypothetical protein